MKNWIYPANPKLYDVVGAFTEQEITAWPMSSKVQKGDNVYIYCGAPYKQIMYKCLVREIGIPMEAVIEQAKKYIKGSKEASPSNKSFMILKTERSYNVAQDGQVSFSILKQNGLKGSIMGPQCLENNNQLFEYLQYI